MSAYEIAARSGGSFPPLGRNATKVAHVVQHGWKAGMGICVEDPFEHNYNVAHVLTVESQRTIKFEFALAYARCLCAVGTETWKSQQFLELVESTSTVGADAEGCDREVWLFSQLIAPSATCSPVQDAGRGALHLKRSDEESTAEVEPAPQSAAPRVRPSHQVTYAYPQFQQASEQFLPNPAYTTDARSSYLLPSVLSGNQSHGVSSATPAAGRIAQLPQSGAYSYDSPAALGRSIYRNA
jgi:hypothetical protein